MTHDRRFVIFGLPALSLSACETIDPVVLEGILGGLGPLTQAEAAQGIRAALNNGVGHAISVVGILNGFWGNDQIRVPLPRVLQDVQSFLQPLGFGGVLNNLHQQLNRGAEKAAPIAKDIFVNAITSLSITDAINIVQGADNAATLYLQDKTSTHLASLFSPIMENALNDTGALRLLDDVTGQLGAIPFGPNLGANAKADLIQHGVNYGMGGLFKYMAVEEKAIRDNPAKRTSQILQRVFGTI